MATIIGLTFPEERAEEFLCPQCGKSYKSADGLKKHLAKEHPEQEGAEEKE